MRETQLWDGEYGDVYATYDRLFDCRRHGWANVQSTHLNLPFGDDGEFVRLHAAARLLLPILPALAAASPIVEGRATGRLDNRLDAYRTNAARVPRMSGAVIPEDVGSIVEYHARILDPLYAQLEPLDPLGQLRHEFANARGAIARFDRHAIEIRLLDAQECPRADVAICTLVSAAAQALVAERHASLAEQRAWPLERLVHLLERCTAVGPGAPVDRAYARALTGDERPTTAGALWRRLFEQAELSAEHHGPLLVVLEQGTLAQRLLAALDGDHSRAALRRVWGRLADCLAQNRLLGE